MADLRLQHQAGEKAAQDAEARAFNLLLDLQSAEKKAKSLRETSNRLNPEPHARLAGERDDDVRDGDADRPSSCSPASA